MLTHPRLLVPPRSRDYPQLADDLHLCRALTHRHARSFSAGIRFFPERVRATTYALYGFVRLPDDIVDEQGLGDAEAHAALTRWIGRWNDAFARDGDSEEPVFRAMAWAMRECAIPRSCTDAFFDAMLADTRQKRYADYADLRGYMHGSAAVVGEMMCHVCGADDPRALPYARLLGEAFQMTNFLRDVDADYRERGRIYLPADEMARFGVTEDDIAQRVLSPRWREFMAFQIARTRDLYAQARPGIALLPADCRFGVALAADIYGAILDRIEEERGDVFSQRVRTSAWRKLALYGKRRLAR